MYISPFTIGNADPQPDYISTFVDLIGGLEAIREKAARNFSTNQFDFDLKITSLISRANIGLLAVGLCSQVLMHFEHGVSLVSVSEDGLQLLELYTFFDAELKSPVVRINGVDAVYHLEAKVAVTLGLQDPDAPTTTCLLPPRLVSLEAPREELELPMTVCGPGAASQTVWFANGTNLTIETTASWSSVNVVTNHTDGESLFNAACLPNA
ncbi:hypothetical protein MMC29_003179 [Sticta canariensis]|nr:hypothetical protein [Sticta canariensis]